MTYYEHCCACCGTVLTPSDPRTKDRSGTYCTRMSCIARNQTTTFENRALEYALATARIILRNKSNPAKCDHGAEHYGAREWDWCENCEPVRAHLAMAGAA